MEESTCETHAEQAESPIRNGAATIEPESEQERGTTDGKLTGRSTLKTALELERRGFWVVPIRPNSKRPIDSGWGLKHLTARDLRNKHADTPGAGIGILLGPERGPAGEWLIDVEGDGPGAEESRKRLLGESVETIGWDSDRGAHQLFATDQRFLESLVKAGGKESGSDPGVIKLDELPGLEFRIGGYNRTGATKQVQSNVPPTPGDSGKPRAWHVCEALASIPEVAFDFLYGLIDAQERKSIEDEELSDKPRNRGKIIVRDTSGDPKEAYCEKALEEEAARVASTPKGGRNRQLFESACNVFELVETRKLDRSKAERDLREAALQAGLGQEEISTTLASAARKVADQPRDLNHVGTNGSCGNGAVTPVADPIDLETAEIQDRWPKPNSAMFHGVAGRICEMADPHTEADKVATLVQFLAAFGNLIGRRAYFRVGATEHYLNLFVCLVGATATGRKGTSWDVVRWLLGRLNNTWASQRIQSGVVSGEGIIYHIRDPRHEEKEVKDKKTGKTTTETVLVDKGVEDKRILLLESEFARLCKAANSASSTITAVLRQAWDCAPVLATLGKREPTMATDPHVSLVGHVTQPDLKKFFSAEDSANGFGNRVLWLLVRRSKLLPEGGAIRSENWTKVLDSLRDSEDLVASSKNLEMRRTIAAAKVWRKMYADMAKPDVSDVSHFLSRATPQVMRLAGLFAVLDHSLEVRPEHLLAAAALWDYCRQSTHVIFGGGGDTDAPRLVEAIRQKPEGLTRTQISCDVFARHRKTEVIVKLLQDLLTAGVIHRKDDRSTGGRPTERWFYGSESGC